MTSFPFPFPIADWKSGSRTFQLGTISVTISLLLCQLPISSTLIFSSHSCFVVFPVNAKMDNNRSNAFSFVLKWKSLADSVTEFLFHAFLLLLLCVYPTHRKAYRFLCGHRCSLLPTLYSLLYLESSFLPWWVHFLSSKYIFCQSSPHFHYHSICFLLTFGDRFHYVL